MSNSAFAGPFILSGTDADDHGSVSAAVNQNGWLYMQKVLENLGANVTNGNNVVDILGSSSTALNAANSAFDHSGLVALGWTRNDVAFGSLGSFFTGTGVGTITTAGILMMDSGSNVGGGVDGSNFTAHASAINGFVGAGGGLFSQANGYQWLTTLLPSVTVISESNTGISLTAAGNTNFPGLTNADLSAGPYHEAFTGYGVIPVLGTSNQTRSAIIIGGSAGGSITNPGTVPVPEPMSLALIGIGMAGFAASRRRGLAA